MSHKVTNAGAFFAYVGKGLGVNAGVGSAYASIVGYVTIQLAIYGFFGLTMGLTMAQFGVDLAWWAWALIAWLLVTGLSLLSVDIGAKILGVLLAVELLSLIVTAVTIFINGGPEGANVGASFDLGLVLQVDLPELLELPWHSHSHPSLDSKQQQSMVKSPKTLSAMSIELPTGQLESSADCLL